MEALGYYNGTVGPLDQMMVPMNDRVCYFGDGVYEAAMVRNGRVFALEDHLDRFYNSAGLLKIRIGQSREELTRILYDMISRMGTPDLFLYWQATRGTGVRQHQFLKGDHPANLWITIKEGNPGKQDHLLKLTEIEDTRFLHCNIKTLNLIPNVMAAQKAEEAGCNECVFHRGDTVTECAHSNIAIIKDGILKTHPADHLILPGITRMHLIKLCKANGIPVDETPFTMTELMDADEVLVTSTTKLCSRAGELDGVKIGQKAPQLVELLQNAYMEMYRDMSF